MENLARKAFDFAKRIVNKEDSEGKKKKFTKDSFSDPNIHIGDYTYGTPRIYIWTTKYHVYIGKFCSIGRDVKVIVDGNHRAEWITTYLIDEKIKGTKRSDQLEGKGDVVIGNDVWFGDSAMILPGVRIGDGAVIGAGAVVTKNVDNYEIVAGNPAKHIGYRFSEDEIKILMEVRWWNWPIEQILQNSEVLQSPNVRRLLQQ